MQASLKFWLEHGVDGFRFYGVEYLVESANLTDAMVCMCILTSCHVCHLWLKTMFLAVPVSFLSETFVDLA